MGPRGGPFPGWVFVANGSEPDILDVGFPARIPDFSAMRFLALIAAALLPLVASAGLQKGVVEVGAVQGTSVLKNAAGRSANLTKGLTFREGHRVETSANSTAELIFSNGATILVTAETQIEVKIFSQVASPLIVAGKYRELSAEPSMSIVQIELYRGKIIGEARKLNPSTQFTVKTPVGLTRVRGTVWTDEYTFDDKRMVGQQTTTVVKGEVEVNDLQGSLPTPLIGGQEIVIVGPADKPERIGGVDVDPSGEGDPVLPSEPKTEVRQADPEKVKEVVEEFKGGTTAPPPAPAPPGGGTTDPGPEEPGAGDPTDPAAEPTEEKPKPTPPPPSPPPPPLPPEIETVIQKETQENLSPSGTTS